jgi:hypothetical protein
MARRPNKRVWSEEDAERLRQHIESGGSAMRASVIFKRSLQAVCCNSRLEISNDQPVERKTRRPNVDGRASTA